MPIVTGRKNVLAVYEEAAKKGWVIPCICSENLTTTEAILTAASDFAKEKGYDRIPITLAITNQYDHRSQSVFYTNIRRWDVGLKLFRASIEILAEYFGNVDILIHLDHAQHDTGTLNQNVAHTAAEFIGIGGAEHTDHAETGGNQTQQKQNPVTLLGEIFQFG